MCTAIYFLNICNFSSPPFILEKIFFRSLQRYSPLSSCSHVLTNSGSATATLTHPPFHAALKSPVPLCTPLIMKMAPSLLYFHSRIKHLLICTSTSQVEETTIYPQVNQNVLPRTLSRNVDVIARFLQDSI